MDTKERKVKVFEFTQLEAGQPVKLYVGAVPADVLESWAEIDVYDAGKNPGGYQRIPIDYRVRQVSRYAREHEGILPTAILLNIREGARFVPDETQETGIRFGTLVIDQKAKLWVVDGQHRLNGLKDASERLRSSDPEATLGYELPVVFSVGLTAFNEMRLFDIVNSRAKSVPTDLAAQLIREAFRHEGKALVRVGRATEKDFRKAIGTKVAYHLNGTPGPWIGKLRLPNQPRDTKHQPLQVNAVAASLEPALRDPYIKSVYEPETDSEWPTLCGLVHTYWTALADLMPEAFADIENYSVQRTAGVYAFHLILPDVLYRCLRRNDFSTKTFADIIGHLGKWAQSGTWSTHEDGDSATRSTGMGAIRELADTMRAALPPVETPGLPEMREAAAV
jgi:DGQHR domain-containing protein